MGGTAEALSLATDGGFGKAVASRIFHAPPLRTSSARPSDSGGSKQAPCLADEPPGRRSCIRRKNRRSGQPRYRTMTLAPGEFHQALSAPRSAEGIPLHPPLRIARQCQVQGPHRARQTADRRASCTSACWRACFAARCWRCSWMRTTPAPPICLRRAKLRGIASAVAR